LNSNLLLKKRLRGPTLLLLGLCFLAQGQVSQRPTYQLPQEDFLRLSLEDSVQPVQQLSELGLSQAQAQKIRDYYQEEYDPTERPSAWTAFTLKNSQAQLASLYLQVCVKADTAVLFSFSKNGFAGMSSVGINQKPSQKIGFSEQHYLPIALEAFEEKLIVTRVRFSAKEAEPHFDELFLSSAKALNKLRLNRTAFQYYYAGFILLLSLLAGIGAWLLKNKALGFYALTLPFFVPYFLKFTNTNGWLVELIPWFSGAQQANLALFFQILFASLFISEYLTLPKVAPWFSKFNFGLTTLALCGLLGALIWPPFLAVNYLLLAWLVTNLLGATVLSLRGFKNARVLLMSFGALLIGAIFLASQQLNLIPISATGSYAFQLGTMLFSIILFYALATQVNTLQQEKARVEELNALKTNFYQDISHELRTPLSLVIDPVHKVWQKQPEGPTKKLLATAQHAAQGLLNLVNQILDLSKLESVSEKLTLEPVELVSFLQLQLGNFDSMASEKQIALQFKTALPTLYLKVNPDKMQQVVSNLLSNALKFTPPKGKVTLSLSQAEANGTLQIKVSDTGPGISAKALPHVFDRYFQASENKNTATPGTGIGLALTKAIVEQHQGSISVKSELGKGATFTISLPSNLQILEPTASPQIGLEQTLSSKIARLGPKTNAPQVLVIEDHPQLRSYLVNQISAHYRVIEAANGNEGLSLAQAQIPELIVSDLMMPGKNGYEVTEALKADPRTSHIPLILLTAKAHQSAKLKGLEMGADDYLLKPFDSKELLLRIANLLSQRETWRKRFANNDSPLAKAEGLSKVDQHFLQKLEETLTKQFSHEQFSVEDLASAVAMSKTHLNRKLKALIGKPASKLIQNFRLQQAKLKIAAKEGNVSEIALACGFNSTAYFVKCFKEKYGTTPGALI
jgi:signal transduction histidine kinase/DNA-binding response OmpR family regulator